MATITIDGKDYDTDTLPNEVKAQLVSLQFCNMELQRLQAEAAAYQTARMQYANALKVELEKSDQAGAPKKLNKGEGDSSSGSDKTKKKGLLGGLFGKK